MGGDTFVISGLREKRARIAGEIRELEARIVQCEADLVHVDATLRMFAPDIEPRFIPPRAPFRRSHYFRDGQLSRRCLDFLRDTTATAVSADDIVAAIMLERGYDLADRPLRSGLVRTTCSALNRLVQHHLVERIGRGNGARWKLAPIEPDLP